MWCVWFITHLPAVALPSSTNGPLILGAQLVVFGLLGWLLARCGADRRQGVVIGLLGGLLGATVNLLLLGSKLVEQPEQAALSGGAPTAASGAIRPGAGVFIAGWYALSAAIGAAGVALGGGMSRPAGARVDWLAALGVVTCAAFLPLLLIGGLVTSTASGMAVPDWPSSYGANMFLYPLSLMSHPRIFMEHSHRLFGALVGLTSMAMMVATVASRSTDRKPKILAVVMFALVCGQGVLGGLRVTENHQVLAMLHGILAQLTFALACWLAAVLMRRVREATPMERPDRLLRVLNTGMVHAYVLQLAFGAAYRHLRELHALWSHIGFSFIVLLVGVLAGTLAQRADAGQAAGRLMRRAGMVLIVTVSIQFLLGWGALGMMGKLGAKPAIPTSDQLHVAEEVPPAAALVRTLHQANGAILLGTATLCSVLGHRLAPKRKQA
jgi:cytochrome c oxidase assembly protein subunit 15